MEKFIKLLTVLYASYKFLKNKKTTIPLFLKMYV